MKILFATENLNKVNEIRLILPKKIEIITLKDIQLQEDIPETSNTIRENSLQKINYIKTRLNIDCFADDTGLEINALNGRPGVYSARYAGPQRDDDDNIALVLKNLKSKSNRCARFKTVIALSLGGNIFEFEGIVNGNIVEQKRGDNGFGYDPIFEPENCGKTFAEMSIDEKSKYSHRSIATAKMIDFLTKRIKS